MSELEVHVVDENIIVNLPGTRCSITYKKMPDWPGLIERPEWTRGDPEARITLTIFRARAWQADNDKARELGAIVQLASAGALNLRTGFSPVVGRFSP
jgi:hypothetical protein